ncbi:MAG: hypothetical protein GX207_01105 [Peptococcaceae bacterium]|nr:hypothetical protein [Peptococcaceae bacterium]
MAKVKILDCTLRDGGRIINCAFPDAHIRGIAAGLTDAKIDYVEMGFLRGNIEYSGNSTMFTQLNQIDCFIPENRGKTEYLIFSDYGKQYGMWDFSKIVPRNKSKIDGFRIAYRKEQLQEVQELFHIIQENGYKLFVQCVESMNYSDFEMLQAIEVMNEIRPYAFSIVDTFGAMYKDDVLRFFNLLQNNLDEDIAIDFHSHNNMQLSFSFAQEIVEANNGRRELIIDSTLEGCGRGAGNLNTELIVDYLNRKQNGRYDMDIILDTLDEYLSGLRQKYRWGYNVPAFMSGIYSAHPNNVEYLTKKHRLATKDIRHILAMIDSKERKTYNYDNIENLYVEYFSKEVNDKEALEKLRNEFRNRDILVLVPGLSLKSEWKKIEESINKRDPLIISVNYLPHFNGDVYTFFGNQRRYDRCLSGLNADRTIITSNVSGSKTGMAVINFNRVIDRSLKYFDNSVVMLFNLLRKLGVKRFMVAGLDGYDTEQTYTQYEEDKGLGKQNCDYKDVNEDIRKFLKKYVKSLPEGGKITNLTGGQFEEIFSGKSEK